MAYMSQEGFDALVAELQELESVRRPQIAAQIAEARDKGDPARTQSMMPPRRRKVCWR